MPAEQLFDAIVIVDWSANSQPKLGKDSIWIGTHEHGQSLAPRNISTRAETERVLVESLRKLTGRRVLVGFDFSFGYPQGFAAAAGLHGAPPWRAVWQHLAQHVEDDERNDNNRWAVAADLNRRLGANHFWGVPPTHAGPLLTARKPPAMALPTLRHTEQHLRSGSNRRPMSTWQLFYNGSVGSQSLTGIPALHRLRHDRRLGDRVRVWPFETGFTSDPCAGRTDAVVVAEVWPSTVALEAAVHPVKDAQQVTALAAELARLNAAGQLGERFAPSIAAPVAALAVAEEGWVLH